MAPMVNGEGGCDAHKNAVRYCRRRRKHLFHHMHNRKTFEMCTVFIRTISIQKMKLDSIFLWLFFPFSLLTGSIHRMARTEWRATCTHKMCAPNKGQLDWGILFHPWKNIISSEIQSAFLELVHAWNSIFSFAFAGCAISLIGRTWYAECRHPSKYTGVNVATILENLSFLSGGKGGKRLREVEDGYANIDYNSSSGNRRNKLYRMRNDCVSNRIKRPLSLNSLNRAVWWRWTR